MAIQRAMKKKKKTPGVKKAKVNKVRASPQAPLRQKIRIGIIWGKNYDPIPVGTHDRNYPHKMRFINNTGPRASGWGGMFHIDVSTGLKIVRLHPDIFEVDFMKGNEMTQARLRGNHLNFNFAYDVATAMFTNDKRHVKQIMSCQQSRDCRMWPSWGYYEWVVCKSNYMKQCMKAGIPIIDTIFVEGGFDPKSVLKKVQAKGWDKIFIKQAHFCFFGNGAIHGRTQDFIDDISPLEAYARENKDSSAFFVQPFTLKPNGNVYDEVRNFFIDGEWAYSVYTDGTDDEGFWEQPPGRLKEACKNLSLRAYAELAKVSKWQGKPMAPLLTRVDIGVVPDKSRKDGFRIFMNEIECEVCTWLPRYCPFNLCDRVAEAAVKKVRELLEGILQAGGRLPAERDVRHLLRVLDERLGTLSQG